MGKDVAKAFGYKDTSDALKKHLDAEDKLSRQIADSGQGRGHKPEACVISHIIAFFLKFVTCDIVTCDIKAQN